MGTFEVIIADPTKSAEESFAEILHGFNREAVLAFARELNEKIKQIVQLPNDQYRSHTEIIYKSDFLSVLHNHGIEEKELMKLKERKFTPTEVREILIAIENLDCHNQDSRHFEKLDDGKEDSNCYKKLSDIRAEFARLGIPEPDLSRKEQGAD